MENETNFRFMRYSTCGIYKYFSPMWKADISFSEKWTLYNASKMSCVRDYYDHIWW